jgi:threonylcarbamoyladenosine tRNA methylthiotransferase MtaB
MFQALPILTESESTGTAAPFPASDGKAVERHNAPTCAFVTLGCKINQYETEAVREEILDLGYREVPSRQPADVYIVNTCSVTRRSGVKSRRYIQRVARLNPESKILVMGCSTPSEKEAFRQVPQIAVLAGNEEKAMIASFLEAGVRPGDLVPSGPIPQLRVPKRNAPLPDGVTRDMMDLTISRFEGRTRGYIKIQDGCNSFCSFCIIPYLRGLSRSRDPQSVLDEARRMAENGFRELVLAGIHLQDFGEDIDGEWNLARLLRELREIAGEVGLFRIRLSSIGVQSFTPEMVDVLRDPLFCPHWHIPIQSGDDGVLVRMRRDYSRQEFLDTVGFLSEAFDDPSITTDVIVGHPGEDDAAFQNTVDLCTEVGFAKMHLFPYSQREGTRAAEMDDQVPQHLIQARMKHLGLLEKELARTYKQRFLGRSVEVLVEGPAPVSEAIAEGLTERYIKVRFPVESTDRVGELANTLQHVEIEEIAAPEVVVGKMLGGP